MGDADKNKGMNKIQLLYPDVIYRFNAIFINSIWQKHQMGFATTESETENKKDVFFVPVFFSKHSRSFRWIGLDSFMWDWENESCQYHLKGLINDLKNLNKDDEGKRAWKAYLDDMPDMEIYKEAIKTVNQAVDDDTYDKKTVDAEMHRALLALYSGSHHGADKNIEGVVYKSLNSTSHFSGGCFDHLKGDLRLDKKNKKPPFDWLVIDKKPHHIGIDEKQLQHQEIARIFLDHLLLHNDDLGNASFGNQIADKKVVALIPLYDLWLNGHGYGGIKAVIIVWFKDKPSRRVWLKRKFPELRNAFPELAEEVRESAETLAASLPITPPYDLVRHFLGVLSCVQDWESAAVFKNGEFQYGYKRIKPKKNSFKFGWNCVEKDEKEAKDFCQDHKVSNPPKDSKTICKHYTKRYMWWTINLWDRKFIPGLNGEEFDRFGNLAIRFEFPQTTHIPSSDKDCLLLYQEYLRQQLDLMRMLIPKVRARRSALRNAAVSIMARNMSHNIGSHVLAAVRGDNKADMAQINRLNEHLQRRMDFIAELATVEVLSAADNLLFDEVLGVEKEIGLKAIVDGSQASGLNAQKLLLKHISGVQVSVEENGQPRTTKTVEAVIFVKDGDKTAVDEASYSTNSAVSQGTQKEDKHERVMVSFNSGVLGWQALYVILENIIRNVAKHGGGSDANGKINVFLKVLNNHNSKKKYYDEFFEVCIWDDRGKAGRKVRDDPNTEVVEYLAKSLKQPRFLDDDNAVTKKDWGMKEMYISAAFLRGVALSDLEGLLPQPPLIEVCAMNDDGEVKEVIDKKAGTTFCVCDDKYKNLGFRLYLPKAKNVAIIVDDVAEWHKSFGDVNGNNEDTKKVGEILNSLKKMGVNFFSVGTACGKGTRIPHRYGVWLSKEAIPEERRAELPLDLIANEGMAAKLKERLERGEVEDLILDVRNRVLEKRLKSVAYKRDFNLWTYNGEISRDVKCGNNLVTLTREAFGKAVVFDWHGEGVDARLDNWLLTDEDFLNPKDVIDKDNGFAFYESHRSFFPQVGLFPSLLLGFGVSSFEQEALCAALTPVLILDERFQRIADQESIDYKGAIVKKWRGITAEFKMGNIWERMRVHVPLADECDVERPNLNGILKYINSIGKELGKGAYVVVHQTIFEKLRDQEKDLAKYLAEGAEKYGWINVVCSGRGVPWQLQGNNQDAAYAAYRPRFIALSALLQCLEHMPSKLHLIRLLEVTRAPSKI